MASRVSLLSEVRFASFLVYSPRGSSNICIRSRRIRDRVKNDHPGHLAQLALRIAQDGNPCAPAIGPGVLLVPAPRSAPLVSGALWPAYRIAEELVAAGLGDRVLPLIAREHAVQKSAFAQPGSRPTAGQHLESFGFDVRLPGARRIAVVDDFITKGATLLAAASLTKQHYPTADVWAFALIRTMGLQPEIERIVDPAIGSIVLSVNGGTERQP